MSPCLPAPCKVDGCSRLVKARGMCNRHYLRDTRNGGPLAGAPPRFDDDQARLDELWSRIDKTGPCWVYRGPLTYGYGTHHYAGKQQRVHRLVYGLLVGPIPDGMTIDHLCHTADPACDGGQKCPHRACCNPDHLEPVTHKENVQRGIRVRRETCRKGHPYDIAIERRGGTERRCSVCETAKRLIRTARDREARRAVAGGGGVAA